MINDNAIRILLADDDEDDRLLFKEALSEIPLLWQLETVYDGVFLMDYLSEHAGDLPDILFLDLNMPRKNGFECLAEIKAQKKWRDIPLVIYSTSAPPAGSEPGEINLLFKLDGHHYVQKPDSFEELKTVLHGVLAIVDMKRHAISELGEAIASSGNTAA